MKYVRMTQNDIFMCVEINSLQSRMKTVKNRLLEQETMLGRAKTIQLRETMK